MYTAFQVETLQAVLVLLEERTHWVCGVKI
jgi:hypothetical protein